MSEAPPAAHSPNDDAPPRRAWPAKCKRLALNLLVLCIASAVALVLAEIAVRLVAPQPLAGVMFSQDPRFGFWNLPDMPGKKFQSEPGRPFYRVTTDSSGYRGPRPVAPTKPPETRRIVVVGDSFTFGVGVDDHETYPAQLGVNLDATLGSGFEVVNAGCPGWGTESALAFWRARGPALDADLLVVAFYRNDLADNMRRMLFRVEGDRLVHAPRADLARAKRLTRFIPFYRSLSERSHLVNLLRRRVARRLLAPEAPTPSARDDDRARRADDAAPGVSPALAERLALYERLMLALADDARAGGVPLLLVLLPGGAECMPSPPTDYGEVARLARRWADEGKLDLLDLRDPIASAHAAGAEVFQPHDGHYTADGNRIVARALAARIAAMPRP